MSGPSGPQASVWGLDFYSLGYSGILNGLQCNCVIFVPRRAHKLFKKIIFDFPQPFISAEALYSTIPDGVKH